MKCWRPIVRVRIDESERNTILLFYVDGCCVGDITLMPDERPIVDAIVAALKPWAPVEAVAQ